ncbi:dTDP-glucose 4,6-dehydratase [Vreelandella utahensis]|uniref:dTDP-glucose 4,6-dehydratase n=1 Tax=Vreelandella halophila TaxID=86177 RepID=UPI0009860BC2|nr:dTDP-glucose 4,6-dehydratase [Halomonas utahensis]
MRVLVTGGAGFIGSHVVELLLKFSDYEVLVLDKLTYAGSLRNLEGVKGNPRFRFIKGDICDPLMVNRVFQEFAPQAVLNLAAESHVDRSIDGPEPAVETNVKGTTVLLEASRHWLAGLSEGDKAGFRFLQVSTDEVFGDLASDAPPFSRDTPYAPSSPYSASKASADHLVSAWGRTYGIPVLTTHCSNNYGPRQHPEKLIPHMIFRALSGKILPVYGDGSQVRDWLHVKDHAHGLLEVLRNGTPGRHYLLGNRDEHTNREIVESLCDLLMNKGMVAGVDLRSLICMVPDRPGHDRRYAIDPADTERELGWSPGIGFEQGLANTVDWYLEHLEWVNQSDTDLERRGLNAMGAS